MPESAPDRDAPAAAWLRLARAPGLHAAMLRTALARLAPDTEPIEALAELLALPGPALQRLGLRAAAAESLAAPDEALLDADQRWLERAGWQLIGCLDAAFPPLLTEIADAPVALFIRGSAEALSLAQLAIVGSRSPTAVGRKNARAFATELAGAGLVITSGLAVGVDAASHEGALDAGGHTLAVLGHGPDTLYPAANRALAERLVAAGGTLISEFAPGTPPQRANFPRRNRLISGLSLGVLVVEAAARSGSLITARFAGMQGREVFAIPGSIHNPLARGCHELLRQGATLVEGAAEVTAQLKIPYTNQQLELCPEAAAKGGQLDKGPEILLDALGFEPASIDSLVDQTGLPSPSVAAMLLILELEGRVGVHPGGRYVRLR